MVQEDLLEEVGLILDPERGGGADLNNYEGRYRKFYGIQSFSRNHLVLEQH